MFTTPRYIIALAVLIANVGLANAAGPQSTPNGATRVAILSLGSRGNGPNETAWMPGLHVTAEDLRAVVTDLREDRIELVVVRLDADGVWLREAFEIADAIDRWLDPEFRVVIWVEHASGAAAAIAFAGNEIVMTQGAEIGPFTSTANYEPGFFGVRSLDESLEAMETLARRNGHSPELARAMVVIEPLSYTRRATNSVDWCLGTDGQVILSNGSDLVRLDATSAAACGFSIGTCDDHESLARLLRLDVCEWVGEAVPEVAWPVSSAERSLETRLEAALAAEREISSLLTSLAALGDAPDAGSLTKARGLTRQIQDATHRSPSVARMLGFSSMEEFDRWINERMAAYESLATERAK